MSELKTTPRLQSIDALRGLVIMIMLLDHVRETFYLHKQVTDPMNITETEPALFWSRTLAHLCAPVFVLLTGVSAYLFQSTHTLQQTRQFLLKRGLFLIVLELTLVNFAWTARFPPQVIYLQVIWAIGLSMLVLAICLGLSRKTLCCIGLLIIFGHNLLDNISFNSLPVLENIWMILHQRGWIDLHILRIRTSYPVLPWIGVIFFGYSLGEWFTTHISLKQRHRYLLQTAGFGLLLFFILRYLNLYGDHAWQSFDAIQLNLMSFFNLSKYPPSLLFILWNSSVGILVLVWFDHIAHYRWLKPLIMFGSVPMFFYLLHLYVLKLLYLICLNIWGNPQTAYFYVPQVSQLWAISFILLIMLYPVVRCFAHYKHSHKQIKWLKYF